MDRQQGKSNSADKVVGDVEPGAPASQVLPEEEPSDGETGQADPDLAPGTPRANSEAPVPTSRA